MVERSGPHEGKLCEEPAESGQASQKASSHPERHMPLPNESSEENQRDSLQKLRKHVPKAQPQPGWPFPTSLTQPKPPPQLVAGCASNSALVKLAVNPAGHVHPKAGFVVLLV
jgi:hypothetical protein